MFDSLTKSKFYSRCKSLVRMTKTRLEVLKKKKKAVAKYLKDDVAELLKRCLDYNAYGRAEALLVELNVIACYEFIEQFCGCILSNLTAMDKQKGCPDECKEAVQSLVYAAARFAEFPELRDLRALFAARYGSSLDLFINKEFVEKSKQQQASKEAKLQMMRDIAKEFSVQWSSQAFEQKLFQPQAEEEKEHSLPEKQDLHDRELADEMHNPMKSVDDTMSKGDQDHIRDDHRYNLKIGNKDGHGRRYSYDARSVYNVQNRYGEEPKSHPGKDSIYKKYNFPSSSEDETASRITRGSSSPDSLRASSSSVESTSDNEEDTKRKLPYRYIPAPYLKPKCEKKEEKTTDVQDKVAENNAEEAGEFTKPRPRSVRSRPAKPIPSDADDVIERPLKPPPGREYLGKPLKPSPLLEKVDSPRSPSQLGRFGVGRRDDSRRHWKGFSADGGDRLDEEEKILDGLLMHYSNKGSPSEMEKLKPQGHRASDGRDETLLRSSKSELSFSGSRAEGEEPERPSGSASRSHTRSVSMKPALMAEHVHPNLPEYDDLAAQLAGAALGRR